LKAEGTEGLEAPAPRGAAMQEIRESCLGTPKGPEGSLERWNEAGGERTDRGHVVGTEPGGSCCGRIRPGRPVDIGELTSRGSRSSFAARPAKKPGDERTAALLALLGGDREAAAKCKVELPERWRNFAPKARPR
jgi:hypothetical protein